MRAPAFGHPLFLKYLLGVASCLALLTSVSSPACAEVPPIGYVGPVPRPAATPPQETTAVPPIGYVGPVARPSTAASPQKIAATPPIGYVGPVTRRPSPVAVVSGVSTVTPGGSEKTLIGATRMSFNQEAGVVTAAGHVEITHGGYALHADKVTYNQKTDVMRAEGHVAMLMPSGEIQFADMEEVTGDMKEAFIANLGVLFPDNSRLAARTAQRYEGRYMVANKGMYTACNVCKEDPDNPPLWQLRAGEVTHDNVEHNIYYHDATLDLAGVPVLYTPYFSTPDPTVERRQGFLTATPGVTPNIGAFARLPYYFDIAPDIDAVFAPTFSEKDKLQLAGEYRQRFGKGYLQLAGSAAYAELLSENTGSSKGKRIRGNLFGTFLYNIDNTWRAGTNLSYSSDKSYLQRYNLGSASDMVSRAYIEGFGGRDYLATDLYYFQDLRPGTQPVQPVVLPRVTFSALGEPGKALGGRWSLDGGVLVTKRDNSSAPALQQGPDTRRGSLKAGWERQFVSDTGLLTELAGHVRGEGYWADGVPNPSVPGGHFNNVLLGRQFEQASLTARYPMARRGETYEQILEPIAMVTAAPNINPDLRQPIEDSLDVQFDETNLFSSNRFTGTDLIEGGSRVTYGLRHSLVFNSGAHFDTFGGQSYSFDKNGAFPVLSGLHDRKSDYVGRIDASPGPWLDINYGFRFDKTDLSPQMQDAHMSFGVPLFRPSMRYILFHQTETNGTVGTLEQGTIGFTSTFAKYWTLGASHVQSFQPEPGPLSSSLTLTYQDECFIFGVTAVRNQISRVDVNSGTAVLFHLYLKNIGGIHTDSFVTPTFPAAFRQAE